MDDLVIGELIGTVKAIKENTDQIPDIAKLVAVHDDLIKKMYPKVENHEKTTQRAIGISFFVGGIAGLVTDWFRGTHG
jgi:hypothetical protein